MTNADRITELEKIRKFMETPAFREVKARRDTSGHAAALLGYDQEHKVRAEHLGTVLSMVGLSPTTYETSFAELDRLIAQAILELKIKGESQDTPAPPPLLARNNPMHPMPAEPDIPKNLGKEHGILWLFLHGHWLVKMKAGLFLIAIFAAGVQAAQSQKFMEIWNSVVVPMTSLIKPIIK